MQTFQTQSKAAQADGKTCLRFMDGDTENAYTVTRGSAITTTTTPTLTTRPQSPSPTTRTPTTPATDASTGGAATSDGSASSDRLPPAGSNSSTTAPRNRSGSSSKTMGSDSGSSVSASSSSAASTPPPQPPTAAPAPGSLTSPSSALSSQHVLYIAIGVAGLFVVAVLLLLLVCRGRRHKSKSTLPPTVEYASIGQGMATHGSYVASEDPSSVGFSTDRRHHLIATTAAASTSTTSSTTHSVLITTPTTGLWIDRAMTNHRIALADITIGDELSRGGFGIVCLGTYKRHQQVAVKKLLPALSQNMNEIESFLSEAKLLSRMKHPRIISMRQSAKAPMGFTASKLKIALHIIEALSYLHGYDPMVVHRDLKSKNVLLSSQLDAKLTDFGVSRERAQDMTTGVGSRLWMAPEVLKSKKYDEKADIFSFGVVLSELDTHQIPYTQARELPHVAIVNGVANGSVLVDFSENIGKRNSTGQEMFALARQCMALKPNDRPTAKQVCDRLKKISSKY